LLVWRIVAVPLVAARIDREREGLVGVDDVYAATGEDQVVLGDIVRVAGQVLDLDDAAGAGERSREDDHAGDDRAGPDTPEATRMTPNCPGSMSR
jgi:hypothetical protein